MSCSFFYVAKQGVYQLKLVGGSEPIAHALRRSDLKDSDRQKLILITEVRDFCERKLNLNVYKNYKDINISWNHKIYNVSASEPLRFKAYNWFFPIVGAVPYKGYFEEKDADQEIKRLKEAGFDTLKGRVGGYSTLGYFSDPVWPSMLRMRDEALVELIIHELAHATVYINNHTNFNETFANFIGKTGTRMFYVEKFGEKSDKVINLDNYYLNDKIYNNFFSDLYITLDKIYAQEISAEEKKKAQQEALEQARINYNLLAIKDFIISDWSLINNAYLLAFKTYNYDEKVFADLFDLVNHNFSAFISSVERYSNGDNPFVALRSYINKSINKS
jgi:predicted aminopeptidase